ncbi:class I SAM-dependent methyltransferase [Arthrobacter castelli]|uniref:class I SAM-dependent methyltransferase n=1 Tax=Arthrobacter castelli TaxID=271431 RepID=UPI0003FF7605|nr:class I SAM-dependent methyltransferase [Arthrobacter castelli]
MSDETRWERSDNEGMRDQYDQRFRQLHAEGTDIAGEARFIDALLDRNSTVLDAGCGSGRLTAELNLRGHHCVGVDKDADLLRTARDLHGPGHDFVQADLLDLAPQWMEAGGCPARYDLIAAIGNVMVFLAPGSERQVLRNFASLLAAGGRLVTGFAAGHEYSVEQFDADAAAAGFALQHRFGTWQLGPYGRDSGWATSVLARSIG